MKKSYLNSYKDFLIIGVGGSGVKVVKNISNYDNNIPFLLVDTDVSAIKEIKKENKFPIGKEITKGLSSGGDSEIGRQSVEKEAVKFRELFKSLKIIIIAGGLGGGTASGVIPVLSRIAREANTYVIILVSIPFIFEGENRMNISNDSIKRMRSHADAIIRIPNEKLIKKNNDNDLEYSFLLSHQIIHESVMSLWIMLTRPGICGLDFSSIHTILRSCDGFCNFASIHIDEKKDLAQKCSLSLINHPLMNKGLIWKAAQGAIILIRGNELKLNDIEYIMNFIHSKVPENSWINFGMQIDNEIIGIHITCLVATSWKDPLVEAPENKGLLNLDPDIINPFKGTEQNYHYNEDLDIPTYRRKNIKLPR